MGVICVCSQLMAFHGGYYNDDPFVYICKNDLSANIYTGHHKALTEMSCYVDCGASRMLPPIEVRGLKYPWI